jgi:hypothetical protein
MYTRLLCRLGTLILFLVTLISSLLAQANPQGTDVPYTGVVGNQEARFSFPLRDRSRWHEALTPAGAADFEWSVDVENDGHRYTFGLFFSSIPKNQLTYNATVLPDISSGLRVYVWRGTPLTRMIVPNARVGSYEKEEKLDILVADPETLRLLFSEQPSHAAFAEKYPGEPRTTHEGKITYTDYDYAPSAGRLQPVWELRSDKPIGGFALSSRRDCLAVTTEDAVDVRDRAGHSLWRWHFKRTSRYIVAGKVAVSPSCEMVAFTGDSSYRYTWIVHRCGPRIALRTVATPLGVAISHRGDLVAVGTGGRDVLLFTPDGVLRWKTTLTAGCCLGELSFSDDDRAVVIAGWGVGVVSIGGKVQWATWKNSMRAARDLKTFVAWWEPPHGPGIGNVSVLDQNGKQLWSKYSSSPEAAVSPSGERIAAWINRNQNPTEDDGYHPDDQEGDLQILSRQGDVISTLPDGRPIAFSWDGSRLVVMKSHDIECMDLEGNRLWSIPVSDCSTVATVVTTAVNLKVILVYDRGGQGLSWFEPNF